jgi:hypothetical protein
LRFDFCILHFAFCIFELPPLPKLFGLGAVLIAAGLLMVLAAFGGDEFGSAALPLYCVGLLFIGLLTWWEAARPRAGVLPSWASPPALIAAWALGWIYAPGLASLLDDGLLDDFAVTHGGETLLVTGLFLACVAITTLSCSYHATTLALRRRAPRERGPEWPVPLRRAVALYLVSTAARGFHLLTLGVAYGTDITAWGALQLVAQWIGYVEDLRFLALAFLVAHVIRRRAGHIWLAVPLVLELVLAVSSGFLMPVILPVVLCVATAAALDRLRSRDVALIAAAGLVVATFVPVIAAVRQDRLGDIGTADVATVSDALTVPAKYWLDGVSSGDGAYDKFFGRQAEVASATGLVMTLTPAVIPFEGLESFLGLPASLIPRAFWPDKPTLSRGVWFSATFRGLEKDTTSWSAMTIFSEGYLFYGWTGVVLAMVIAGVLLALVHRALDTPRLAVVYLALVPTILQIEPEFSSYFTTLVQRSLVFLAVFVLLTHTKNQQHIHKYVVSGFSRTERGAATPRVRLKPDTTHICTEQPPTGR